MQELQIHDEMAAFLRQQDSLKQDAESPWVVFAKAAYQNRFPSFEDAYQFAAENFESGKFLIRDVRGREPFIPLMYVTR